MVGGLAVVLHGHPRLTVDLDLVIDLEPAAARRTIEALTSLGLRPLAPVDPLGLADPARRRAWIEEKGMRVFSFYDPHDPLRIVDLFVEPPFDFEALWSNARVMELGQVAVRVAAIPDPATASDAAWARTTWEGNARWRAASGSRSTTRSRSTVRRACPWRTTASPPTTTNRPPRSARRSRTGSKIGTPEV